MINKDENKLITSKEQIQIDYNKAVDEVNRIYLLKSLSEQGIDVSKMSQQQIAIFKRILDKRAQINNLAQEKIIAIQRDLQTEMINIDNEIKARINEIKDEQSTNKNADTNHQKGDTIL